MEHSQFTSKNFILLSHSLAVTEVRNFFVQKDEKIVKTTTKKNKKSKLIELKNSHRLIVNFLKYKLTFFKLKD